jgi:hypothetical protein
VEYKADGKPSKAMIAAVRWGEGSHDPRVAQRVRLPVIDTAGGVGSSKLLSFYDERAGRIKGARGTTVKLQESRKRIRYSFLVMILVHQV